MTAAWGWPHDFPCWIALERFGSSVSTNTGPQAAKYGELHGECSCAPRPLGATFPVRFDFSHYLWRTKFDRDAGFELDRFRSDSRDMSGMVGRIRALLDERDAGIRDTDNVLDLIRRLEQEVS